MLERYGIFGIISLLYFKIRGMLIFKNARLIRFPFRIRGRKFIKVGKGFTTGFNCRIDAFPSDSKEKYLIEIGEGVQMNDYVHIAAHRKIIIKDNVLIASKVFITDHNHGSYSGEDQDSPLSKPNERKLQSAPVTIEENVWLGEYVSIMPGVTIGKGSIIGTMSVVTKDIPDYTIAVGSPAKVIKKFNFSTNTWDKV
ncbi:acetyltransferase [Chryseobacterium sp. SIMBA_029]|uniref:acetyltransferase n=1 Tax=Chryseobacterium sp. SIMBA_029 TaxID=3085772 RepID=UPI00397AFB0F